MSVEIGRITNVCSAWIATICTREARQNPGKTSQKSVHCNTLQHTAIHRNTLQHTATHHDTLQHAATRCKNFSKVHSLLDSLYEMTAELTCENFWVVARFARASKRSRLGIVKNRVNECILHQMCQGMCCSKWVAATQLQQKTKSWHRQEPREWMFCFQFRLMYTWMIVLQWVQIDTKGAAEQRRLRRDTHRWNSFIPRGDLLKMCDVPALKRA